MLLVRKSLEADDRATANTLDDIILRQKLWEEDVKLDDGSMPMIEGQDDEFLSALEDLLNVLGKLISDIKTLMPLSEKPHGSLLMKVILLKKTNALLCDQIEIFEVIRCVNSIEARSDFSAAVNKCRLQMKIHAESLPIVRTPQTRAQPRERTQSAFQFAKGSSQSTEASKPTYADMGDFASLGGEPFTSASPVTGSNPYTGNLRLSFVVQIKDLEISSGSGREIQGFWWPPLSKEMFTVGRSHRLIWRNGSVEVADANTFKSTLYKSTTMFTQWPNSSQLLIFNGDATQKDSGDTSPWRSLSFEHKLSNDEQYLTLVRHGGSKRLVAAPDDGSTEQLIPRTYKFYAGRDLHGRPLSTSRRHGGLAGDLAILFALAAFTAPPSEMLSVLGTSVRQKCWRRHGHANGRRKYQTLPAVTSTPASSHTY